MSALRQQHRRHAQCRAEQFLRVAGRERPIGDRIGGAQEDGQGGRGQAAACPTQPHGQPDAECADREQARQGTEPVDEQGAAAGQDHAAVDNVRG